MSTTYAVELRKGKRSPSFSYERYPGFAWQSRGKYAYCWQKSGVGEAELASIREKAAADRMSVKAVDEHFVRSSTYRRRFLKANPGPWRCRYCNRKLHSELDMTVDHMVPVGAASRSALARALLKKLGAEEVNSLENLAPSCSKCNGRKSDKLWRWLVPILLGGKKWYWPAVRAVQLTLTAACIAVAAFVYSLTI